MKRRLFLALPAAAPLPAAAFRTEEPDAALLADLQASCTAAETAHAEITAMLGRAAAGQALSPEALRRLATCPFCRCQVAWVPPEPITR
jgi:lipoprotein-anchoring transpeptidase ErfK/SrfK